MTQQRPDDPDGYEPPTIVALGTLAQLTQGGSSGVDDMVGGGSGDTGSL